MRSEAVRRRRSGLRAGVVSAALALLGLAAPAARAQEIDCPAEGAAAPDREACRAALEGLDAFRRGEYRLAAHRFQEANHISPAFEPALTQYWFARSLLGLGKTGEAAFALYRALRAEQSAPAPAPALLGTVRLWLGKTYDLLGRRGAALGWYRQVVDSGGMQADVEEARRHIARPFDEEPAAQPPEVHRLKKVLRGIFLAEEEHWRAYGRYAERLKDLELEAPAGVEVRLQLLDRGGGFLAEGTSADGRYTCKVFSGRGTPPGERGIVFCQ